MTKLSQNAAQSSDDQIGSSASANTLPPVQSGRHSVLTTQSTPLHAFLVPDRSSLSNLSNPAVDLQPATHILPDRFRNVWPVKSRNADVVKWLINRQKAPWPLWEHNVPADSLPESRPNAPLDDWKVWFVGHATVLVQIGPWNFLTDPVWAMRASPLAFAGPRRVRAPGIALKDLPRIDAVLLSHNHYDHMDMASLRWLHQRDQMPIYTGLLNREYLPAEMNIIELDWWQEIPFHADPTLKIVFTPAQHFSGRGLRDRNHALWGGLSVLSPHGHLFFAGDTGYAPHFRAIRNKLGKPRLALLPIGAYEPRAVMQTMHMNPAEAVRAHVDLGAHQSLAIHFRTFQLTDESMNQPLLELAQALAAHTLSEADFFSLQEGHAAEVTAQPSFLLSE